MLESEWRPESLAIAQEIAAHARERGVTPGQFAMAWVLNTRLVTAAVAGSRTEQQWEESLRCPGISTDPGRRGFDRPADFAGPSLDAGLQ